MRSALLGAVMGIAMTIGTPYGAVFAATPASTTIVARQDIVVDSTIDVGNSGDLSNQPMKNEADYDTNSSNGD